MKTSMKTIVAALSAAMFCLLSCVKLASGDDGQNGSGNGSNGGNNGGSTEPPAKVDGEIDGLIWATSNCGATSAKPEGKLYNAEQFLKACPSGWRVPTAAELTSLCSHYSECVTYNGMKGRWLSGKTPYSSAASAVFFPISGFKDSSGNVLWADYGSEYWSSTKSGGAYQVLTVAIEGEPDVSMDQDEMAYYQLRCVKNASGSGGNGSSTTPDSGGSSSGQENPGSGNDGERYEVATEFGGGDGSENDPYIITTAAHLRKLSADVNSGVSYKGDYFRMESDICFNGSVLDENGDLKYKASELEQWTPIDGKVFRGCIDGNGYTISGLYCEYPEKNEVGFIGGSSGFFNRPHISNLTISDSYFHGKERVGSFSGGGGYFENCLNYSTVVGSKDVGGICAQYGRVNSCANYGLVKAEGRASGIYPYMGTFYSELIILNCYNYGNIESRSGAGITYFDDCVLRNVINYGVIGGSWSSEKSGTGAITVTCYSSTHTAHAYYLETSCYRNPVYRGSDVVKMTEKEMKAQSFLDKLNANVSELRSLYPDLTFCNWKFGKDGFPILDFVKE